MRATLSILCGQEESQLFKQKQTIAIEDDDDMYWLDALTS